MRASAPRARTSPPSSMRPSRSQPSIAGGWWPRTSSGNQRPRPPRALRPTRRARSSASKFFSRRFRDVRHRLFAILVLLAVLVGLSGATFTWTNPTTRTDGSPLTNLADTRLWCGDQPGGSKTVWTTIPAPGESYSELFGLDQYCAATARDTAGLESPYSNEVFVLAQGSAPATPESPTIQFQPFTEPPVAITENPLTSSSSATNGTVFTSASITPGANRLVLLSVEGDTVSGGGFTLTATG